MMLCNQTSRFHVAAAAVRGGALRNQRVAVDAHGLVAELMHCAVKEREWILANGKDHDDMFDTPVF
jgi:xylulose-5-phosphate/fructose-6-phosphate phosphoketolase